MKNSSSLVKPHVFETNKNESVDYASVNETDLKMHVIQTQMRSVSVGSHHNGYKRSKIEEEKTGFVSNKELEQPKKKLKIM